MTWYILGEVVFCESYLCGCVRVECVMVCLCVVLVWCDVVVCLMAL